MCYSNRPINNSNADHLQSPRLSITHPPFHTSALSKQKNSSLAAILLSFVSASSVNFFFIPPPNPTFSPQRGARSFVRGCRRLNDRSTLLATLFADRSAGLVLVFTYPRERGQLDGVPRAAEEDRESFDCHHEEACVSRRHSCNGRQFRVPTSVCVCTAFPLFERVIGETRCCLSSRSSLWLKHTFRYTVAWDKKREKGRVKGRRKSRCLLVFRHDFYTDAAFVRNFNLGRGKVREMLKRKLEY